MGTKAIISGVHDTQVGALPDSTCMSLHAEAALGALADAGLAVSDIDGLLTAYSFASPQLMLGGVLGEYIGLRPKVNASIAMGGMTGGLLVRHAESLVRSGRCRHVLCVTGDNRLTGMGDKVQAALADVGHPQYEQPYGMSVPAAFAMAAQVYFHEGWLNGDHLAAVAVNQRANAALHPQSHMKKPITMDDVRKSKLIASPLRMLDCCLVSDGGAAVVVSAGDTARDGRRRAVELLGIGEGHTHEHIFAAPSLVDFGCKESAADALAQAGLKHKDVDCAHIYDCFTSTLLITLESMGFYGRGEAGPAALAGELAIGGRFPVNTNGGLLSYGSSGAAGGMFHVVEAVRQLRGECGPRQVKDAEVALAHTLGGIFSGHCSIIMGRA
ncbi:thiolase family protein [Caenimonas sedimenti]|uniref:Thiolase family protein n=1 Tax=Caenimonas sedimenti TaxID=2596921 RepID=A0A562ZSZ3_9BURK|nr:thiolase family protein [Caenimonas sedimenti]TWO71405.1 thiolase family protein [Caenimonas sedimenti]